ncbi:MAG: HU family DNA-binding protein [Microcoleus sp.]
MTNLTDYVKTSTGFAESTVTTITSSIISFLSTYLRNNESVKIEGFGIFKVIDKPEREGRNPRTGEQTTFKASRKVKFIPSKTFGVLIQPDPKVLSELPSSPPSPEISSELPPEFLPFVPSALPPELLPGYISPVPSVPSFSSVPSVPPIPIELLPKVETVEKVWNIKAPDNSFVEVSTQDLSKWGVTATTPIYSKETGWILAGPIPELAKIELSA